MNIRKEVDHSAKGCVSEICYAVMDDVTAKMREYFIEEGADESVLPELRQLWESRFAACQLIDTKPDETKNVVTIDPDEEPFIPIKVRIPSKVPGELNEFYLQVPKAATVNKQLFEAITGSVLNEAMNLPPREAAAVLQNHYNKMFGKNGQKIGQLDGESDNTDSDSGSKESESDDDDTENNENTDSDDKNTPLNSDDDVTDEENNPDKFTADNVILCQYEKVSRNKNKWKFVFKRGFMNLNGEDYIFNQAVGIAEW